MILIMSKIWAVLWYQNLRNFEESGKDQIGLRLTKNVFHLPKALVAFQIVFTASPCVCHKNQEWKQHISMTSLKTAIFSPFPCFFLHLGPVDGKKSSNLVRKAILPKKLGAKIMLTSRSGVFFLERAYLDQETFLKISCHACVLQLYSSAPPG